MFRTIIGKNTFNSTEYSTGILPIKCNKKECVILESSAESLPSPFMAAESLPPNSNRPQKKRRGKSNSRQNNKNNKNNSAKLSTAKPSNRRITRSMKKTQTGS
jgi:hypothetical protein